MALTGFRDYGIIGVGENPNTLSIAKPLSQTGGIIVESGGDVIWLWDNPAVTWNSYNLAVLTSLTLDGNHVPLVRGNTTTGVSPTVGEVASPLSGDTASVYLSNGTLEYWVYSTVWTLAFTTSAQTLSDALVTLSGVASGSVNLGTFTGTTIADNVTIKAAIQALETALELALVTVTDTSSVDLTKTGQDISAAVKLSATQNTNTSVIINADGLAVSETAPAGPYVSHAAATADGGIVSGRYYYLSETNLEFAYSALTKGPFYIK